MIYKSLFAFLLFLLVLVSCRQMKKSDQEKPVARVYDLYLYPSDLERKIPEGVPADDSSRIAGRLIDEWVREKLLLKRAEQYLSSEQKDVNKQLEEYRSSLLTFIYKQKLLSQNLDTLVNDQELQTYYDLNSSNYILDNDVVKINYVRLPLNSPQLNDVKRWYRSEIPEDLDNLEKYCVTYATNYMIHGEKWFYFANLIAATPLVVTNPTIYLNSNKNIEISDASFHYFIHIIDRVQEGQVAPLDLVKDDIRSVIINKRKIMFMEDLENSVYKDGRAKNKVEIY